MAAENLIKSYPVIQLYMATNISMHNSRLVL